MIRGLLTSVLRRLPSVASMGGLSRENARPPRPTDFLAPAAKASPPAAPQLAPASFGAYDTSPSLSAGRLRTFQNAEALRVHLEPIHRWGDSAVARASFEAFTCASALTLLFRDDAAAGAELEFLFGMPPVPRGATTHLFAAATLDAVSRSLQRAATALAAQLATPRPGDRQATLEAAGLAANVRRLFDHPAYPELRAHAPFREALERLRALIANAPPLALPELEAKALAENDFGLAAAAARLQDAESFFHALLPNETRPLRRANEYAFIEGARSRSTSGVVRAFEALLEGEGSDLGKLFAAAHPHRITLSEHALKEVRSGRFPFSRQNRERLERALDAPAPGPSKPLGSDPDRWIAEGRAVFDPVFLEAIERISAGIAPLKAEHLRLSREAPEGNVSRLPRAANDAYYTALNRHSDAATQRLVEQDLQHAGFAQVATLRTGSRFSASEASALAASIFVDPRIDARYLPGAVHASLAEAIFRWENRVLVGLERVQFDPAAAAAGRTGSSTSNFIAVSERDPRANNDIKAYNTVAHEAGHFAEDFGMEAFRQAVSAWQLRRADAGQEAKLAAATLTPVFLTGDFRDFYVGKRYPFGGTEVVSLGQENLQPLLLSVFACVDLEHTLLVAGGIVGQRSGSTAKERSA